MQKPSVLAMYLPQFHRIKENDMWWGEGYTEWTAVKAATPLFQGHRQPRMPLHGKYYDLMDKRTMQWQAELARQYSIDGFCFYHYWFKDGRKILEKPAENLLKWQDVDMPFCFCWDSSTWARTWTKIGNSWADKFEEKQEGEKEDDGVLLRQDFGTEFAWRAHFEYLLPFFQDERYIKVDGRPVFIFYNPLEIGCFEHMVLFWKELSRSSGIQEIYIITMHVPYAAADATIIPMSFHPYTLGYDASRGRYAIDGTSVCGYSYDAIWEDYLSYKASDAMPTMWKCTVAYDDTPRRGLNGRIYVGSSPEKFKRYYAKLLEKSIKGNAPFLFIDAWNEWAEGKYLEPDGDDGFSFLEAVKDVMHMDETQLAVFNNSFDVADSEEQYIQSLQREACGYQKFYAVFMAWTQLKARGGSIAYYLMDLGYRSAAIYGFGVHGHILCDELRQGGIEILYVIDQAKGGMKANLPVYNLEDNLPVCDVVIVSLINDFFDVFPLLSKKLNCPVLSLYETVKGAADAGCQQMKHK